MKGINNRFDTEIDFVESIMDQARGTRELTDSMFEQACEEFGIEEDDAMQLLMDSKEYDFLRLAEGWNVISKE